MAAPINFIDAKVSVPVTASITLDATHKGKLLVNDTTSNFTLTIPGQATVNYPIGSELAFSETSTGRLQLLGTAGVTVKDIDGVVLTTPTSPVTGLSYSMSGAYASYVATVSNMTDGLVGTGAYILTTPNNWIQASFDPTPIIGVTVGAAVNGSWGSVAAYLNGAKVQTWDGSSWVDQLTISGVVDGGGLKTFTFDNPVSTDKVRLWAANYLSTDEFQVLRVPDVFHEVSDRCLIRKTAADTWILETVDLVEQSTIAVFSPTVDFDSTLKVYATRTVTAVEVFTVGTLGKVPGARVLYRLIADGVNVPTFTGFKRQGTQDYLNFAGAMSTLEFVYDGVDSLYRVTNENPFAGTPFRMSVKTDNAGTSATNQFDLPESPYSYAYNCYIAWGDGQFDLVADTALPIHTYASAGTYTVSIWGQFPAIYFNNDGDRLKVLQILQWGNSVEWLSMESAFHGCSNMIITASDQLQARTGLVSQWYAAFWSTGITSFPQLDFTSGDNFSFTWAQTLSLTSFTPRHFPVGRYFDRAWYQSRIFVFSNFSAPNAYNLNQAWENNPNLVNWSALPLPTCAIVAFMLSGCPNLATFNIRALPSCSTFANAVGSNKFTTFPAIDLGNVGDFAASFAGNALMTSFLARNMRVSFTLANCALSAAAINTVFSNLAVLPVAGSQTITVTGNPGAATCTQSIATNKGWVVVV